MCPSSCDLYTQYQSIYWLTVHLLYIGEMWHELNKWKIHQGGGNQFLFKSCCQTAFISTFSQVGCCSISIQQQASPWLVCRAASFHLLHAVHFPPPDLSQLLISLQTGLELGSQVDSTADQFLLLLIQHREGLNTMWAELAVVKGTQGFIKIIYTVNSKEETSFAICIGVEPTTLW